MKNELINYHERIESTNLLGPFERSVIWVHGCCFDCPGCIALNFRFGEYKTTSVDEMTEWFLNTNSHELTISGGEPFLQADALDQLVRSIRKQRDIGVIVYTGFLYEDIISKASDSFQRFVADIDLLIDGPYQEENNNNEPYRGSSNQRIIEISARYKDIAHQYYYEQHGRHVEIRISNKETLMVGVPSKDQALIWNNVKKLGNKGHERGNINGRKTNI